MMPTRALLLRVRGMVGTGITWAVGWAAAFFVIGLLIGVGPGFLFWALNAGVAGFMAGIAFGLILTLADGRKRPDQLSLARVAGWGGLSGLALSTLTGLFGVAFYWPVAVVLTLLGAGSAAGTLAMARQADHVGLLASGGQVGAGLAAEE